MDKTAVIVACIPAFNEEKTISRIIRLTQQYAQKVIVCDDGSTDLTGHMAKRLGVDIIHHRNNQGYGASLRSLFREAGGVNADVIVTLDADGQHDPRSIPNLIEPILHGKADIVIGSRFLDENNENNVPYFRHKGIKLITRIANAVSYDHITDAQSGYRAYSKKTLNRLNPTENGWGASTELLIEAKKYGFNIAEVPVTITYDENSNKRNLVSHGAGVIFSTLKYYFINRSS